MRLIKSLNAVIIGPSLGSQVSSRQDVVGRGRRG